MQGLCAGPRDLTALWSVPQCVLSGSFQPFCSPPSLVISVLPPFFFYLPWLLRNNCTSVSSTAVIVLALVLLTAFTAHYLLNCPSNCCSAVSACHQLSLREEERQDEVTERRLSLVLTLQSNPMRGSEASVSQTTLLVSPSSLLTHPKKGCLDES